MVSYVANSGADTKAFASGAASFTAAGTGDNTAVTGASIDRRDFGSGVLTIYWKTTLGASETLKIAAEYQESDDDSTWGTATSLYAATTVKTGAVTAGYGVKESDVDLSTKKRYIRFNFTPDLSASGTDTAVVFAGFSAGGAVERPAT